MKNLCMSCVARQIHGCLLVCRSRSKGRCRCTAWVVGKCLSWRLDGGCELERLRKGVDLLLLLLLRHDGNLEAW